MPNDPKHYGPYGADFASCVASVAGWSSDPQGFCNWIHQQTQGGAPGTEDKLAALRAQTDLLAMCPRCGAQVAHLQLGGGKIHAPHFDPANGAACVMGTAAQMLADKDPTCTRLVALDVGDGGSGDLAYSYSALPEKQAPTEFMMFHPGVNKTAKGDFLWDGAAAAAVMAAWGEQGNDLMGDYEHMSLVDPPIIAPASIKKWTPQVRDGALWATNVQWTDRAKAMIEAGEYRYTSPAFTHDEETMRVKRVVNMAVTNLPATKNMQPLTAARAAAGEVQPVALSQRGATTMPEPIKPAREVIIALHLADEATAAEVQAKILKRAGQHDQLMALTGKDKMGDALAVVQGWKAAHDQVATITAERNADKKIATLREFDAALVQAGKDGKIPPAAEDKRRIYALSLRASDTASPDQAVAGLSQLRAYVETLPVVADGAGGSVREPAGGPVVALSDDEKKIAAQLGLTPAKVEEHKRAMAAAGKLLPA